MSAWKHLGGNYPTTPKNSQGENVRGGYCPFTIINIYNLFKIVFNTIVNIIIKFFIQSFQLFKYFKYYVF